ARSSRARRRGLTSSGGEWPRSRGPGSCSTGSPRAGGSSCSLRARRWSGSRRSRATGEAFACSPTDAPGGSTSTSSAASAAARAGRRRAALDALDLATAGEEHFAPLKELSDALWSEELAALEQVATIRTSEAVATAVDPTGELLGWLESPIEGRGSHLARVVR